MAFYELSLEVPQYHFQHVLLSKPSEALPSSTTTRGNVKITLQNMWDGRRLYNYLQKMQSDRLGAGGVRLEEHTG